MRIFDLKNKFFKFFCMVNNIYFYFFCFFNVLKGFVFINFYRREDVVRVIVGVFGFGYDYFIFNVEWVK